MPSQDDSDYAALAEFDTDDLRRDCWFAVTGGSPSWVEPTLGEVWTSPADASAGYFARPSAFGAEG